MYLCSKCNKKISRQDRMCKWCGAEIKDITKKSSLIVIVLSLCVFTGSVFVGLLMLSNNLKGNNVKLATVAKKPVIKEVIPESPNERLKYKIKKLLGKKFMSADIWSSYSDGVIKEGDQIAFIRFRGQDLATNNMIKNGMLTDIRAILKTVYTDEKFSFDYAWVHAFFPIKDDYGNAKDEIMIRLELATSEAKKVNWDGITFEGLKAIASDYSESWQLTAGYKLHNE